MGVKTIKTRYFVLSAIMGVLGFFILKSFGVVPRYDLFLKNVFGDMKILGVSFSITLIAIIVLVFYKTTSILSDTK